MVLLSTMNLRIYFECVELRGRINSMDPKTVIDPV